MCRRVNSSDKSVGAVRDLMMGDIRGRGELSRKNQIRSLIVRRKGSWNGLQREKGATKGESEKFGEAG